jgi:hypothetical protein
MPDDRAVVFVGVSASSEEQQQVSVNPRSRSDQGLPATGLHRLIVETGQPKNQVTGYVMISGEATLCPLLSADHRH